MNKQISSEGDREGLRTDRRLYTLGFRSAMTGELTSFYAFFWELRDRNPDAAEELNIDILIEYNREGFEQ